MNLCCPYSRPKLFNWITMLLVAGWVTVVAVVAELAPPRGEHTADVPAFVESLVR